MGRFSRSFRSEPRSAGRSAAPARIPPVAAASAKSARPKAHAPRRLPLRLFRQASSAMPMHAASISGHTQASAGCHAPWKTPAATPQTNPNEQTINDFSSFIFRLPFLYVFRGTEAPQDTERPFTHNESDGFCVKSKGRNIRMEPGRPRPGRGLTGSSGLQREEPGLAPSLRASLATADEPPASAFAKATADKSADKTEDRRGAGLL